MSLVLILKIIVGILSLLFGVISVLRSQSIADFAHFGLSDGRGVAEIRINFGGLFVALGAGVLLLNDPEAWLLLGFGYAGLAVVRVLNLLIDRTLFERIYMITLGFEIVSAIILLLPLV